MIDAGYSSAVAMEMFKNVCRKCHGAHVSAQ
jgi:hypothetical protein